MIDIEIQDTLEYIAFMAHIPIKDANDVKDILIEYDIGTYLIGLEESPYEHMHFLVQMREEDYHKFSKRVFKDKYKLRGRAQKGQPRQYGKVKKIEDLEKMKAYTVKGQNVLTNMSQKDLDSYIEKSFVKAENISMMQEVVDALITLFDGNNVTTEKNLYFQQVMDGIMPNRVVKTKIIELMRQVGYNSITKAKIDGIFHMFIATRPEITPTMIYDYFYPFN